MRTASDTVPKHRTWGPQLLGLLGWVLVTAAAALAGAVASVDAREFFGALQRPYWAPPAWIFGPVWTVLYLLMAVAAWLVWRNEGWRGAPVALTLYLVQLVFNALWSWLFFEWHLGGLALLDLVLLWLLVAATTVAFWRRHIVAGLMLVPYLAWVTFAGFLNHSLWQMNPQLL